MGWEDNLGTDVIASGFALLATAAWAAGLDDDAVADSDFSNGWADGVNDP